MKTFNMSVNCMPVEIIGFGGENDVTEVICDFGAWAEEFGQGAISLAVRRPADIDPYLAVLTVDGTAAHWMITDVETSYKGVGEAQWIYTVGEQVKKSAVFSFCVERSLNSDTVDLPEAYQTWFDDLVALGADVHEVAEKVYEATGHYPKIENGYWYVWNVSTESWTNTGQKAQGEEGAPGVGVASTVLNADYTLTITLTDGTSYTTPSIRGATGNGIASTVLNENYTLTITFTDGTSYTTPSIRGAQGIPGQDYVITSADYDEIAGRVDTMIAGERQQALDDIDEAKTNAVSDVTSEGTTQKGLVTSEGTTQKGLVTSEGTTQVGLVTAKGQEVIQSIPSDYSELSDDVSELKADLINKADIIVSSASGAIASFNDGANYPAKQCVFTMNPVQDLHGYEYPWPGGGGKNLIHYHSNTDIVNGITYSRKNDGSVTVRGTATATAPFNICVVPLQANVTYRLTGCPQGGGANKWALYANQTNPQLFDTGSGSTQTQLEDTTAKIYFIVYKDMTVDFTFYPMLRVKKDGDDDTWSPYSNICPITGRDSVNVYVSPEPTITDGTKVYPIEFPIQGFNQWDEEWESGGYNIANGTKVVDQNRIRSKNFIPALSNTQYFFKSANYHYVLEYDANHNYLRANGVTIPNSSFTTGDGTWYITFYLINATDYNHDISINYPATETGYYPYKGRTVYAGTLTINEDGSGQIVSNKGSVDLGEVTWSYLASVGIFTAYSFVSPYGANPNSIPICSQYKGVSPASSNSVAFSKGNCTTCFLASGDHRLYVRDDAYTDAASFTVALDGVQLVYELATPVTINLTEQEVIETLYGQNNIWHSANGDTAVQYRADTKLYIDNKFAELQTLIANL